MQGAIFIDEDMKSNDIILSDKAKVNERKRNYIVKCYTG